jgi:hypothetical protein
MKVTDSLSTGIRGKRVYRAGDKKDHAKFMRDKKRGEEVRNSHVKAKMLRNYSKLCEKEGIRSERLHQGAKDAGAANTSPIPLVQKKKKSFPFQKELEVSAAKEVEREVISKAAMNQQDVIKTKIFERKHRQLEYTHKNSKGQPKLKHKINNLLNKLIKH